MKNILFALIALVGIVACEKTNEPAVTQKLQLSADKNMIIANGEDIATFSVTDADNNAVEGATIYFAQTKEALADNTFKTENAGSYEFYAQKGDTKSNTFTITAKESGDEPNPPADKTLKLTVDKQSIVANGEDVAMFSTKLDGTDVEATIYLAADDTALTDNTFATTEVGDYTFYAKYLDQELGEVVSNEVKVAATAKPQEEEKPIEITANVSTIIANGYDSAKFEVLQEGTDVTNQSTIYVNGGVLNGNRFSTTTPGTYTIYATKGSAKSNEIEIIAEAPAEGSTTTIFVDGVTLTSGWYDVNKKGDGTINEDMSTCWSASASNMLQWWQDRYVAAGNTLPQGVPNGPGETYELAIYEEVFWNPQKWDKSEGGHPNHGVIWYLEGTDILANASSVAKPLVDGGYFKSAWDDIYANTYHDYTNGIAGEYNNYYIWGKGSGLETDYDILKTFTNLVVEYIARGPVGMAVYPGGNAALHTVTIWGCEVDNATGLLSRIWLTDDGDQKRDPKEQILNEYSVDVSTIRVFTSEFRLPHFTNTDGTVWYGQSWAATLYPVAGYGTL